ncbi:MAG: hypothetical protein J0I20_33970 [Chloroflexi bacterium]|nr:hypothetical protein [Chloroflexota bacterium]OJW05598.1 MAG: hypothetical protein BGO39_02995 [Chloroflexi bacterium 54-19]
MITTSGSNYDVYLNSPVGQRLKVIPDFVKLNYSYAEKKLGNLVIVVPIKYLPFVSEYCQIEIWRKAAGQTIAKLELEALWIILYYRPYVSDRGELLLEIAAVDGKLALLNRIVAYFSGTSQASKSGFAGNIIKSIASENIASTANDYTGTANTGLYPRGIPSNYFSIQPNLNDGASVDMSFAWQNCLEAMQDIADASETAGTYLGFDTVYDGAGKLELRTYSKQRGTDRTLNSMNPVILDPSFGNFGSAQFEFDYNNEINFVYCGGQDTGTSRKVATSANVARWTLGPFSRRETFEDARQSDTLAQVQDSADAALRAGKGNIVFSGQLIETPFNRYGIDYNFGDILPCQFLGKLNNCRLNQLAVNVEGKEEIQVQLTGIL